MFMLAVSVTEQHSYAVLSVTSDKKNIFKQIKNKKN
jgi:hypothetical protein